MTVGMLGIVVSFTIAGLVNVYLVRMLGMVFMTVRNQFISFWILWVFLFGLVLFLPGVLIYLWDFFGLSAVSRPTAAPATGE